MHPHDINCRWCGRALWAEGPGEHPWPAATLRRVNPDHVTCPAKPPLTPEEGAAALGGLMGMAAAIRRRTWTLGLGRACSRCGTRDDFLLCGHCQDELHGTAAPIRSTAEASGNASRSQAGEPLEATERTSK